MKQSIRSTFLLLVSLSCLLLTSCADAEDHEPDSAAADTPGASMSEAPEAAFDAEGLHFSAASGFYDAEFSLSITAAEGTEIYYTLDGSMPTADSIHYDAPIRIYDRSQEENRLSMRTDIAQPAALAKRFLPQKPIDKATVIRAIAVDRNGKQSAAVSYTYFVGFGQKADYYKDTKVISLILDESALFDYETGIYVLGKVYDDWKNGDEFDAETPDYFMPANYTQKGRAWERPATMQFFEDGQLAAAQELGIRIHGGATRSYPQKSLKVYARKDYGAGKLQYDLFSGAVCSQTDDAPITEFDSFVLRNGGNDAQHTRFSDKLVQSLAADRQFLTQGMEPCILFINGEFWGQYEITEKLDNHFISTHYGVPDKEICLIKKEALEDGPEEGFAEWEQLRQWIRETDFSDREAYEKLCTFVDMQGFMEYVSTEIYINNADWGKANMAMWKAQTPDASNPYADGRWRFVLFDTEYSAGIYGQAQPDEDSFAKLLESDSFLGDLFGGALENDDFRAQFRETFLEIAEQDFGLERVDAEIDRLSAAYHDMAIDTYNRFWSKIVGGYSAESNYQDAVESLRHFYQQRPEQIEAYLETYTRSST